MRRRGPPLRLEPLRAQCTAPRGETQIELAANVQKKREAGTTVPSWRLESKESAEYRQRGEHRRAHGESNNYVFPLSRWSCVWSQRA